MRQANGSVLRCGTGTKKVLERETTLKSVFLVCEIELFSCSFRVY